MDVKEARGVIFVEMTKLKMQRKSYYNFEEYMQKDFNLEFEQFINNTEAEIKKTHINKLDFTARVENCLKAEKITTMERLEHIYNDRSKFNYNPLHRIPNFGRKSMDEVREALVDWKNSLGNERYSWNK